MEIHPSQIKGSDDRQKRPPLFQRRIKEERLIGTLAQEMKLRKAKARADNDGRVRYFDDLGDDNEYKGDNKY